MGRSLTQWLSHLESMNAARAAALHTQGKSERLGILSHIAETLALLPWSLPTITVAGTNGKGSCVSMLSSIYKASHYKVGSFTSPHLVRYNERIQINQQPVSDKALCNAFEVVEKARQCVPLGYFEFTTLVGLWLFKQAQLDIAILEVGLGGRLDPVNTIDADIAIISSIDLDHTHILGNSVEAIAFEKSGIMRAEKPCVWGDSPLPSNVKEYAQHLKTPLSIYGEDFKLVINESTWTFSHVDQRLENLPIPKVTHLPNAACALEAIRLLSATLPVSIEAIHHAMHHVHVPGRFQIIEGNVTTILDVAHNPASAQLLAKNLKKYMPSKRILLVVALSKTKDIVGVLSPLIEIASAWYLSEFEWQSCPVKELNTGLNAFSIEAEGVYSNVKEAYVSALQSANTGDVVVVMGSFHTVGAVMELLL